MRRGFELLLGVVAIAMAWFAVEFLAVSVFVIGAVVFVAFDQFLGRVATGVLAGAAAGVGLGLAPSWARPAFWLAAAPCAALGFVLERGTGFLSSQVFLGAGWAAFSLGAFGGPMLEAMGGGAPARVSPRARRLIGSGVLGGLVGGLVIPTGGEPGPVALRLTFALSHLVLCSLLRRQTAAGSRGKVQV